LWYCCIPPCEMHFLLVRWWCWILSCDACELWISVNLDVEFQDAAPDSCQILDGSRMQPASRQQVTVRVAYVSVTGVN
jgi:hypothetical protein